MRIGFDIDGVIVDTISAAAVAISDFLGCEVTCEDVIFRFDEIHEVHDYWIKNAHKFLCCSPPIEGVCAHINELLNEHELYFISARGIELLDESRNWFENYGLPKDNLFFTSGEPKAGVCKELGLDLFIEDSPKNAQEIALAGIPVLLMETEYNKDYADEKIVRCKDWDELMQKISSYI